jgi:hypothetical protein
MGSATPLSRERRPPTSAGANTGNDDRCARRDAAGTPGKLVRSDRDGAGCPVKRFTGVVTEQDPSEERVPRGTNHDQIGGTLLGEVDSVAGSIASVSPDQDVVEHGRLERFV